MTRGIDAVNEERVRVLEGQVLRKKAHIEDLQNKDSEFIKRLIKQEKEALEKLESELKYTQDQL